MLRTIGRGKGSPQASGGLLEQQDRRGRVGDRDVVAVLQLAHAIGNRAARGDPVQELDALRAGLLDDLLGRVLEQRMRVVDECAQAVAIELRVDEAARVPSSW